MDLSLPLRSLIPSLDADVLAVLARTESSLGASQVARLSARGSRQGIARVLDRLAEHGLVVAQPTNMGHVYQLNRDHLLTPALLAGLSTRGLLREQLRIEVARLDPTPVHASLFGSLTRGDGGPGSDIDLFLVVPDDVVVHGPNWTSQMRRLQDVVIRSTGNRLEPLAITRATFHEAIRSGEPLIESLAVDAETLVGTQFAELLAEVAEQ